MAEYRQKTRQYIINSAKQPIYIHRDDYILFNLNACFVKSNNYARFESFVKEALQGGGSKVNLCNLASLCYKLGMDYCSDETFDFVQTAVEIIRQNGINVVQDGITLYGETDMQPIESLISYDRKNNVVYTNHVLVECLKIIGFADVQVRDVVEYTKDFRKIIPSDLIEELPIRNRKTLRAYNKIKDLFI